MIIFDSHRVNSQLVWFPFTSTTFLIFSVFSVHPRLLLFENAGQYLASSALAFGVIPWEDVQL